MKKSLIILCLCFLTMLIKKSNAQVTAYLSHAVFETPEQGPYIETYLSVIGSTIKTHKNKNDKYQGVVEIGILFLQNKEIKAARKYILNGPENEDTIRLANFIDQQRFILANGNYTLEVTIRDKNIPDQEPFITKEEIQIQLPIDKVTISDIQLLESYSKSTKTIELTKSGYDLIPYVSNFYPENSSKIKFYAEVYHASAILGNDQKMVINYFIESYENKVKKADYASFIKPVAEKVNPLLGEFNIENLPTGNYNLVVEIRDRENKLLAEQHTFFQRKQKEIPLSKEQIQKVNVSNSFVTMYKSADTLSDYIRSLRPISSSMEIQFEENLLKEPQLELLQQFFYNFWYTRNSLEPQVAWNDYHVEVLKVNKEFSTYGLRGYDTDRGRVYLQYGPPDSRNVVNSEPSAYPYEMWQYNTLVNRSLLLSNPGNRQSNKRFVFYNRDLVSNKYMLIHSDARGEIINTRWQMILYKRNNASSNLDDEKVDDNFGSGVNDNYINPK